MLALLATLLVAGLGLAQNPGDVLISESMYDDTASTDVEWAEIYNTTANPIDISGWTLQDAPAYPPATEGSILVPAGTTIAAGQYLVLCKAAIPEFTGEIVCTQNFGSWALGNSGDNLALYTGSGTLIDGSLSVIIPDSSLTGGNSTERCSFAISYDVGSNWHQSTNVFATTGRYRLCTPGAPNSACGASDTTPPTLLSAAATTATTVDLLWNESVGLVSAQTVANYVVNNGVGNPLTATRDGANLALVHLTFNAMANNTYSITCNNVADVAGNVSTNQIANFTVNVTVAQGAVVITEVMYDDTASGTNPDVEWVEIHNTTASAIDLSLWRLTDYSAVPPTAEGNVVIPAGTSIPADGYLVLSKVAMPEIPSAIVCVDSGSLGLGNSGDNLALYTADFAQLVDGSLTVNYPDLALNNGGHSIEKCDVNAPWSGLAADWHESTNVFGTGRYQLCTPGAVNSPCLGDTTRPTLVSATALSTTLIEVVFNEALNEVSAETVTNYSVDLGVGSPSTATLQTTPTTVRLLYGTALAPNTYTLTVNNVADVALNAILPNSQVSFTVSAPPENLKFTEFMPNPAFASTGDSLGEWFEIYNAGATTVDLTGWIIADNSGSDTIEAGTINPGQYFVFCSNGDSATNGGVPENFDYRFATSGWGLSLSNTGETIFLRNPAGTNVATVTYTTAFHWGAGVSAQLIDLNYSGAVDTMWCAGYQAWPGANNGDLGTPGTATACAPVLPPDTLTLCQVREQDTCGVATRLNTRVVTHGVVTWVDSCGTEAFVESGGCAVQIFGTAVTTNMVGNPRPPMVGDTIEVWSYITQFRGVTEFSTYTAVAPVITYLGSAAVPAPVVVAASAVATVVDDCGPELYESRIISVLGATFLNAGGTFAPGDTTFPAVVGTDTVLYYVDSCDVSILGTTIPAGAVNLRGALGQHDLTTPCLCGGYQIVFAGGSAFEAAQCPDPTQFTVNRDDSLATTVTLRWTPGLGAACNTYKVYASTNGSAVFPATYTLVATVVAPTPPDCFYTDPSALAPIRFYHVTADN
ncbi:lamin tail domain-containing protein [candidate division KSB1 bacterium]|nr:lamin tail domain-containing protein [candidate division KSB1 bacterium]